MLTVFADESHDGKKERIFVVAGVMGTQEEWDRLKPIWNDRLKRHPWKRQLEKLSFHAVDCDSDEEDFEGISHEENQKLYKELVMTIAEANLVGFGAIMDLIAYRRYFPNYMANAPYQRCFHRVVTWFAQNTYMYQPGRQVKFIFDVDPPNNFSSGILCDNLANLGNWKYAQQLFEELGFASRKRSVGVHLKPNGLYVIEDWGTGYWDDWPDGKSLDLDSYFRPRLGRNPFCFKIACKLNLKIPMRCYSYGMVGFIKQLLDEQGAHDATRKQYKGRSKRGSKFQRIIITASIVFVKKAYHQPWTG